MPSGFFKKECRNATVTHSRFASIVVPQGGADRYLMNKYKTKACGLVVLTKNWESWEISELILNVSTICLSFSEFLTLLLVHNSLSFGIGRRISWDLRIGLMNLSQLHRGTGGFCKKSQTKNERKLPHSSCNNVRLYTFYNFMGPNLH